jgi:hypothetical protein
MTAPWPGRYSCQATVPRHFGTRLLTQMAHRKTAEAPTEPQERLRLSRRKGATPRPSGPMEIMLIGEYCPWG